MACPFCKKEHTHSVEESLDRMAQGPQKIREALAGASDKELAFAEPKPGGWTPKQVAAHLMDTELVWSVRFRKLLAEDNPALPGFDQEKWAALAGERNLDDILKVHEGLRKQNVSMLRAAAKAALDHAGNHPEYGKITLRDHILHGCEHDAAHAAQIRRIRDAYAKNN